MRRVMAPAHASRLAQDSAPHLELAAEHAAGSRRGRGAGANRQSRERAADPRWRWQGLEVRHLVALAAVAQEGSFRRAAEALGYVQSAISGQIAHLERAAGVRLLDRASGTPVVELTDAGRLLLRHVDEILARLQAARADLDSLPDRAAGTVRVAGLEHFAADRVAQTLGLFRRRHPFARFSLVELETDAIALERLCAGELELLVCGSAPVTPSVRQIVLERDEYVLLAHAGSPVAARREPLSAAEIGALDPIIPATFAAEAGVRVRLAQLGIEPSRFVQPDSVATAQALVAGGVGAAIVPARLVDADETETVAIGLSHLLAPRAIVLAVSERRADAEVVQGFIAALRETGDASSAGAELPARQPSLRFRSDAARERPRAA